MNRIAFARLGFVLVLVVLGVRMGPGDGVLLVKGKNVPQWEFRDFRRRMRVVRHADVRLECFGNGSALYAYKIVSERHYMRS